MDALSQVLINQQHICGVHLELLINLFGSLYTLKLVGKCLGKIVINCSVVVSVNCREQKYQEYSKESQIMLAMNFGILLNSGIRGLCLVFLYRLSNTRIILGRMVTHPINSNTTPLAITTPRVKTQCKAHEAKCNEALRLL